MAIKFFVQSNEYGIMQIPVNPASIQVSIGSNNRVVNVLNVGDVTVLRNPKLEEYSFECFFPRSSGLYTNKSYIAAPFLLGEPDVYIENIKDLMNKRKVVKFVVSELLINSLVTIESFDYISEAGDDDITYSMKLKKYVPYGIKKAKINDDGTVTITQDIDKSAFDFNNKKNIQSGALVAINGAIYKDNDMTSSLGVFNGATAMLGMTDVMGDKKKYQIKSQDGEHIGWAEEQTISAITKQII